MRITEKSQITEDFILSALSQKILVAHSNIHGRQKMTSQRSLATANDEGKISGIYQDAKIPLQLIGAKALMYSLVTKEYTVEYTTYGPTKNTNRYVGPSPGLAVQYYNDIEVELFTDYVDREGRKYELV